MNISEEQRGAMVQPPRRISLKASLLALLIAFLGGGALVAWLTHGQAAGETAKTEVLATSAVGKMPATMATPGSKPAIAVSNLALPDRVAALEARIDGLALRTDAAAGNVGRAERLLVAFATRRAIERGDQLGYLERQLQVHFGASQPNAVVAVVEAANHPVTLLTLSRDFETIAEELQEPSEDVGIWQGIKRELGELFVVRRDEASSPLPDKRLARAQRLIEIGQIEAAIGEVARMPGRGNAAGWTQSARRYVSVSKALDVIETAAIVEAGEPLGEPKPLPPKGAANSVDEEEVGE